MNLWDVLILLAVGAMLLFALRLARGKAGGCSCGGSGGCAGNCGDCAACCEKKEKTEQYRITRKGLPR